MTKAGFVAKDFDSRRRSCSREHRFREAIESKRAPRYAILYVEGLNPSPQGGISSQNIDSWRDDCSTVLTVH